MVLHWFKCVQPKLNALPTQQCSNGNASEALLSPRATTLATAMAIAVALSSEANGDGTLLAICMACAAMAMTGQHYCQLAQPLR